MNEKRASPGSARALSSQTAWSRSPYSATKTASGSHQVVSVRWWSRGPAAGRRRARRPASVRVREVAEVAQQRAAVLGGDRLGVELDAPQRSRPVLEPHDDVVGRPRRHTQGRRHRADGKRVVAHGREALRDAGEQAAAVVMDLAETPVHDPGRMADDAAGDVGERLMAEADAEHRQLGALEHVQRDPDVALVLRAAGARRDHDVVHGQRHDLLPRQLVVAHDDRFVAVDLTQQVEEVEGERVVVVDQKRAHGRIYTLPTLAQERLRLLRRRGVETVILAGADTHGIMRGKRLPIAELPRAAEHGVALCEVIWALPVDEREPVQRPQGHAGYFPGDGYPDMLAVPDLETARIVPWHDRTALLLCDFVDRDGSAVPLSPRAVLRSVVARAQSMGVEPVVG